VDFLKSVAGMFTSSLLRLAVAVGVLAAAYFFIVRPILDTTDKALDTASGFNQTLNTNIQQSVQQSNVNPDVGRQIQRQIKRVNRQVQRQLNRNLNQAGTSQRRQRHLLHCVQRANGNVKRIQRCTRRF
jgi:predicted PurR-regulated permease PerM